MTNDFTLEGSEVCKENIRDLMALIETFENRAASWDELFDERDQKYRRIYDITICIDKLWDVMTHLSGYSRYDLEEIIEDLEGERRDIFKELKEI